MAGAPGNDDGLTPALDRALLHARAWTASVATRRVPAVGTAEAAAVRLGRELPAAGLSPAEVVDRLAAAVEPGLMTNASGRFFGWVMGSALPAAVAADWLVSAWDQNAGMRAATPGVVGVEDVAAAWLLALLGLPPSSTIGFTTGATTANFTCLAAARGRVLADVGWDVAAEGLVGAPRVHVLAGEERHGSVDLALRYLGLGRPITVAVDAEGRLEASALRAALAALDGPTVVCLQAGNLHSGAFDPFPAAVETARAAGAWVHVDGAFGLWAAVTPRLAALTDGMAGAHSWATDAHKTLNTPYDGGIAVVADPEAMRTAMGLHASYLFDSAAADPHESVPELSRRARGVPIWAALASLGADGVRGLVEGLVEAARELAVGIAAIPGASVVNRVDYTQVCVAFESDERTAAVYQQILAAGEIMPSASVWHGATVIRFSVSSFRTGPAEVRDTVAAVARAAAAVPSGTASMHA